MRLQDTIIALILVSVFTTVMVAVVLDFKTRNSIAVSAEDDAMLSSVQASAGNLSKDVNKLQQNISQELAGAKVDTSDTLTTFVAGAFSGGRLVLSSVGNTPNLISGLVTNLATVTGIPVPAIVLAAIGGIMLVVVGFALISGIFKWPL